MPRKNIRKIPDGIKIKLDLISGNDIVVFVVKTIPKSDVETGKFSHLGIQIDNDKLSYPSSIIPPANQGRFSSRNINGYVVRRDDLPKEPFTISFDAPNWGDWSYGSHTVDFSRERYPREHYAPKLSEIKIECQNDDFNRSHFLFKFEIDAVLNKIKSEFEEDLFFYLNILQENVSGFDVAKAGTSFNDHLKSLNLSWELLPPGNLELVIRKIFKNKEPTVQAFDTVKDRYQFFNQLNAQSIVVGSSGMQRYFGALIRDDLVVFENLKYGNAVYVMFENWKVLSQKSRIDLLSGRYGKNFERVVHLPGWKQSVIRIINARTGFKPTPAPQGDKNNPFGSLFRF